MSFWTADRNRASAQYGQRIAVLIDDIEPERRLLFGHPVYRSIHSLDDLHIFMQHHVFAVWDFMSLLKALQRALSCVAVPWVPQSDPKLRRLINDIVMSEETDEDGLGSYASHFELYRESMCQAGADTGTIDELVQRIRRGERVRDALGRCGAPVGARRFVDKTFDIIETGELQRIAACFTFGREDVVPDMFRNVVREMRERSANLDRFIYYLDRHIAVDTDVHGPMAFDMISMICGDEELKWGHAREAALTGIRARIALWDAVVEKIEGHHACEIMRGTPHI